MLNYWRDHSESLIDAVMSDFNTFLAVTCDIMTQMYKECPHTATPKQALQSN